MAQLVSVVPDRADQPALVGLLKALCHLFSTTEAPPVIALGMVQRALEGVGVHGGRLGVMTLWGLQVLEQAMKKPGHWPGPE